MDKEQALKIIEKNNVATLLEVLISNGESELAMLIIQNCWGDEDEDVIDYIDTNWEF